MKVLIKFFEKNPHTDIIEAKIQLKHYKEKGIDLWKE